MKVVGNAAIPEDRHQELQQTQINVLPEQEIIVCTRAGDESYPTLVETGLGFVKLPNLTVATNILKQRSTTEQGSVLPIVITFRGRMSLPGVFGGLTDQGCSTESRVLGHASVFGQERWEFFGILVEPWIVL